MFLHHILNCDENRLINQVLWAQEKSPTKNDWVLQIREDLAKLGLEYLTLENIKHMTKERFKSLIKMKCQSAAFKYLIDKKKSKSKMTPLTYNKLNISPYLISGDINLRRKQMLFKLRTRMMPTPENYGGMKTCNICEIEADTTDHVLSCLFLKIETPEILDLNIETIQDVYSADLSKQILCLNIFEKMWRKREEILDRMK